MTDRRLDVQDPLALRALAHPLRVRLLRLVREHRPITGARLADLTGESTASVSYHLSVLARHGFIEPDPEPGPTRRHRPWRTTFDQLRIASDDAGVPPVQTPQGAVLASLLAEARAQQDAYLAGAGSLPGELRETATFSLAGMILTPAEHDRLAAEIQEVLDRYPHSDGEVPAGSARFAVSFVSVPTQAGEAVA